MTPLTPRFSRSKRSLTRTHWRLLIEYIGSLLLLVSIGAVLMYGLQQQKRTILSESQQTQTMLARIAEAQLVGTLRAFNNMATELAALHAQGLLPRLTHRDPRFWPQQWQKLPEASLMLATDPQGRITVASHSDLIGRKIDGADFFKLPREFAESPRLFISLLEAGPDGERALVFSRTVLDAHNKLRGVVAITLPCSKLDSLLKDFRLTPTQTVTLMLESGEIIAREPTPEAAGRVRINANTSILMQHNHSGQMVSVHEFTSEVDQNDKIGAAITLNPSPIQTNQSLVITISELTEVVLSPWRRMQMVLWGYLLITLVAIWFGVVSYQRRLENEGARALIESLLDNPALIAIGLREDGRICLFNPAAEKLSGYTKAEVLNCNWLERFIPPADLDRQRADFKRVKDHQIVQGNYEGPVLTRAGTVRMVAWRTSIIRDHRGWMLLGLGTDITEHRAHEAELETQAQIDALTGIPNRRHFLNLATKSLSQAHRHGHELSVLMLDIDHFKTVNDTYGHHTGDLVLQEFARRCTAALRTEDLLGRLGGEEFGVIMPETDSFAAQIAAERIRHSVADSPLVLESGQTIRCTVSIGIAMAEAADDDCETLLQKADAALYAAKRDGRNRTVLAPPRLV